MFSPVKQRATYLSGGFPPVQKGQVIKIPSKTILTIAISILVIVSVWSIALSPYFRITEVVVKGQYFCPLSLIDEVLDPNRLGNIFTLSTRKVKQRLLQNPWIDSVKIKRKLPNTLEVVINEAVPVAALATGDGFCLISEEAVPIQTVEQLSKYGVPVFTTSHLVPLHEGKRIDLPFITEAARAIATIRYSELPVELSQAHLSADGQLTCFFKGGLKVSFGEMVDLPAKLRLLLVIFSEEGGEFDHIDSISLAEEKAPVVMYKLN